MKKMIALQTLALFPLLIGSIAQASLGPGYENPRSGGGSYSCTDRQGELNAVFSFGAPQAQVQIKGNSVPLTCTNAAYANSQDVSLFKDQYIRPLDICIGKTAKGDVVLATSNSMGSVQMYAVLLNSAGQKVATATLNCESVSTGSGW